MSKLCCTKNILIGSTMLFGSLAIMEYIKHDIERSNFRKQNKEYFYDKEDTKHVDIMRDFIQKGT